MSENIMDNISKPPVPSVEERTKTYSRIAGFDITPEQALRLESLSADLATIFGFATERPFLHHSILAVLISLHTIEVQAQEFVQTMQKAADAFASAQAQPQPKQHWSKGLERQRKHKRT